MSVLHTSLPHTEQERLRILSHLDELLESPAFSGSSRRQAFLRYVVEESLAGRGDAIKERNLAVDVFQRDSDFDAQSASIVRVTGGEVRKRLAQAYASGLDHGLRIELPLGSYHPVFHFAAVDSAPAPAPATVQEVVTPVETPKRRRPGLVITGVLAAVGVIVAGGWAMRSAMHVPSAVDRLWQPFLEPETPVLISLVSPTVLDLHHRSKWMPLKPGTSIPAEELIPVEMSYVGTGGALGAARFAEQLALRHQSFQLKFGTDVAFADLKRAPSILLGPSRWMQELMRTLRFRLEIANGRRVILDSEQAGREWSIPPLDWPSTQTDGYCLVTRWLNSETGRPVLTVAGLDPRDTQAGVEFLSNTPMFETFARTMPAEWPRKSFQVVLHNTIHGSSPGSISVVAWKVW